MPREKTALGKKHQIFSLDDSDPHLPYRLIFPCILIIFVVFIYPVVYSAVLSFHEIDFALNKWSWVGFKNFVRMANDKYFLKAITRTTLFTVVTVAFEMVAGVLIAQLLHQRFKGRGFARGIMILPWALPTVVNAIMWKWVFNANYGIFNALLQWLGLIDRYQIWLGTASSAFTCIMVANIWKETPYVVLLTIAALAAVDRSLYEAATVDGCGPVKSFFRITLPIIRPTLLVLAVTKTIWSFQTFDLVYIMTAGGPGKDTELISYYIQKNTFRFLEFGYGAAMSYVLMFVTLALTILYIKSLNRNEEVV